MVEIIFGADQYSSQENCSKSSSTSESDDADQSIQRPDNKSPSISCASSKLNCKQKFLSDEFKLLKVKNEDDDYKVLKSVDFDGLIEFWKETGFKNIITMVGAGISTCKIFKSTTTSHSNTNTKSVVPI